MFYSIFNEELSEPILIDDLIQKIDMVKKSTTYKSSKYIAKPKANKVKTLKKMKKK